MSYRLLWKRAARRIGVDPDVLTPADVMDELTDEECRELALASLTDTKKTGHVRTVSRLHPSKPCA